MKIRKIVLYTISICAAIFVFWLFFGAGEYANYLTEKPLVAEKTITFQQFVNTYLHGKVDSNAEIYLVRKNLTIFDDGNKKYEVKNFMKYINRENLDLIKDKKIKIQGEIEISAKNYFYKNNLMIKFIAIESIFVAIFGKLSGILFLAFLAFILYFSMKSGGMASMFKKKFQVHDDSVPKVRLNDVAGMEEVKHEITEMIDAVKNKDKYLKLKLRVPKGAILYGSPGNGKTLIAKAIAGEMNLPLIIQNGSNFIELFAGMGAKAVRDLFDEARKLAKEKGGCVIFIDEIDAIGGKRDNNIAIGHDERKQTIDEFLAQLDGFHERENIIVIGATNMIESLDSALIRSNRFDRKIYVPAPGNNARKEILQLYLHGKPLDSDINVPRLADMSPGFSGSDLENWVNEAGMQAARRGASVIAMADFIDSRDRILVGVENSGIKMSETERKTTAYHEAGHALVRLVNEGKVDKISIKPIGQALGVTYSVPDDKILITKKMLEREIQVLLGGRVAEEIFINDISNGASNDIQKASQLAYESIAHYGFSEEFGEYSPQIDESKSEAEKQARSLIKEQHIKVREIMLKYKDAIEELATALLDRDVILESEINEIFQRHHVVSKV